MEKEGDGEGEGEIPFFSLSKDDIVSFVCINKKEGEQGVKKRERRRERDVVFVFSVSSPPLLLVNSSTSYSFETFSTAYTLLYSKNLLRVLQSKEMR